MFNQLEGCIELLEAKDSIIGSQDSLISGQKKELQKSGEENANLQNQVEQKNVSLNLCEENEKRQARKINILKWVRNIAIPIIALETLILTLKN